MTAALLLPVVPNITAAAIGAVLASHFVDISPSYSMHIWIASYVLLGPGILTALFYLTLYLQRLHFHHIPPNETIVSSFLPLGPCGLGGFSSLKLGTVAVRLFPLIEGGPTMQAIGNNGRQMAGWTLWGAGLIFALMLWGLGIWFMFIAVSSFAHRWKEGTLRFNMGWWGFTFPLASLTLSTLLIGSELDSKGFQVVGTVFTLMVIILWTFVSIPTVKGACSGSKIIFAAPCLSALEHSDGKGKSPEETIQADERNPSPSSTASGSVSEKTK
ncbi:Plasma membrane sulfite pump involved in sulfite metabolism [Tulasnella sp. 331]|nr:Plasma membrane sulfite pump involved in sulfite metabolism [Tulasnella sp. 331]